MGDHGGDNNNFLLVIGSSIHANPEEQVRLHVNLNQYVDD